METEEEEDFDDGPEDNLADLNVPPPGLRLSVPYIVPSGDVVSFAVAIGLNLLVQQVNQLLQQVDIFRAGNGGHFLHEPALASQSGRQNIQLPGPSAGRRFPGATAARRIPAVSAVQLDRDGPASRPTVRAGSLPRKCALLSWMRGRPVFWRATQQLFERQLAQLINAHL